MTSDLTSALREAIEARLQLARAAAGHEIFDGTGIVIPDRNPQLPPVPAITLPSHIARFLAANDPATVELHCLADLAILDLHQRVDARPDPYGIYRDHEQPACFGCGANFQEEYAVPDANDCPIVKILARAYGVEDNTP